MNLKIDRRILIGTALIVILVFGLRLDLAFTGVWEIKTIPKSVRENKMGVTRSLTSFTSSVDFDETFYGAPDLRFQKSSWYHTSGVQDSVTGQYKQTDWDEPYQTFDITDAKTRAYSDAGEPLFDKDMNPVYETSRLAYDIHLFYSSFQISTDGDSRVVETPGPLTIGDWTFDHETSYIDNTEHGDLGRNMDVTVRLEVSVEQWAIRQVPGEKTHQQFGIMNIFVGDYDSGEAVNLDSKKAALRGEEDYWDDNKQGSGRRDGFPQSGDVDMWWTTTQQKWDGTYITPTSYGVPDVLPTAVGIDLHSSIRLRYILGWKDQILSDDVVNVLPIDCWIQWGLIMEVLTVSGYWIYTDPLDNVVNELYTDQDTEYKPPGFWESIGDFFEDFDLFGVQGIAAGLVFFGVLMIVGLIAWSLFRRTPQMQALRMIGGRFRK